MKPISITSKCVTSKSAQTFDGKTSKSDAIVLSKFFNKLFCRYTAILPVDGATKVGGKDFHEDNGSGTGGKKKKKNV